MRLVEVDTNIVIEAPQKLQPDGKTLEIMCKVALETARAIYDLPSYRELRMKGASIRFSTEISPERGKAITNVNWLNKTIIIRLPQEVHQRGIGVFDPDLFTTVAVGVTLYEAGLRDEKIINAPGGKQAIATTARGYAHALMQKFCYDVDPTFKISDDTNPLIR